MNTTRKFLVRNVGLASAAALGLVAIPAISAANDPVGADGERPPGHRRVEVIRLIETDKGQSKDIDVLPKGDSLGDYFAFHSVLENLQGRPAGRADGFGVLTGTGREGATMHFVTVTLPGGQIMTQNSPQVGIDNGNGPQAVTGGTGRFQGVGGQVTFEERGEKLVVVIRLIW